MTSWLQAEVERRADTRQGRALALFDALEELLASPDFDGGSFLSRPHETADGDGGVHLQDVRGLVVSTETLEDYAREAGASHPRRRAAVGSPVDQPLTNVRPTRRCSPRTAPAQRSAESRLG